jgi:hypothetical protein
VPIQLVKYRLLHANYWWMGAAVGLLFLFDGGFVMALAQLLQIDPGLKLNPKYNLRLYFLGLFYNVLLPGGIGGDGYKIFMSEAKHIKFPAKNCSGPLCSIGLAGFGP